MCLGCSWYTHKSISIYIYIHTRTHTHTHTHIYVPWYHTHFRSQYIKQPMNQFSNTQQSVTTAGYDELRWTSLSNKLSPVSILEISDVLSEAKCSLCLVAAFCVHSVECVEGVWGKEEFDIYRAGKVNFILLTEWQEEFYKCLRNPPLKLFTPYHLSAPLILVSSINVTEVQVPCSEPAANCT